MLAYSSLCKLWYIVIAVILLLIYKRFCISWSVLKITVNIPFYTMPECCSHIRKHLKASKPVFRYFPSPSSRGAWTGASSLFHLAGIFHQFLVNLRKKNSNVNIFMYIEYIVLKMEALQDVRHVMREDLLTSSLSLLEANAGGRNTAQREILLTDL